MAKKPEKQEIPEEYEEEKVKIRHTITAEETFTLAKDVFDIRCFIKNVYANRAVIFRRLNILSISVSSLFTFVYAAYLVFCGFIGKLNLGWEIAVYAVLGVYAALIVAIIAVSACANNARTGDMRKIKKVLTYSRVGVRLLSLAISIAALAISVTGGEYAAPHYALDVLIIVFSIIILIIQLIPLLCGGLACLARWLLSPVKVKYRFSAVALEWYELAINVTDRKRTVKVAKKHCDDIGRIIDFYLLPALGKRYINSVKPQTVLNVVAGVPEEDKAVTEGVLKSVFAYAEECGYVTFNPCRDLDLEGSVEEEPKQKKTMKERLFGIGKKIGKNMLDKYIADNTESESR